MCVIADIENISHTLVQDCFLLYWNVELYDMYMQAYKFIRY